jgi:protein-S-isoprenylcysteine O-methyltransferase Ste14
MNNQPKTITPRVVLRLLFFIVLIPFLPLLISREWGWWEAWLYAAIGILGFAISRALAARRHPDLIAERARFLQQEDAKPWDKTLSVFLGLGGIVIPVVAGLDALYDWSPPFSLPVEIAALAIILAGHWLGSYALVVNRFFSGMVRIQTDRGHHVVSSGPYRWIRHPGYAAALLTYLGTPFFLGSVWIFLPAIYVTVILVIRTRLEDRTLQEELMGYREYAGSVRYRLLPGIW